MVWAQAVALARTRAPAVVRLQAVPAVVSATGVLVASGTALGTAFLPERHAALESVRMAGLDMGVATRCVRWSPRPRADLSTSIDWHPPYAPSRAVTPHDARSTLARPQGV